MIWIIICHWMPARYFKTTGFLLFYKKALSYDRSYAIVLSKGQVITHDSRPFGLLFLHTQKLLFLFLQVFPSNMTKTLCRILAVPNKAVFCNSPTFIVTTSLSCQLPILFVKAPRVPTTAGNYLYLLDLPYPWNFCCKVLTIINLLLFFFLHPLLSWWSYVSNHTSVLFLLNDINIRSFMISYIATL